MKKTGIIMTIAGVLSFGTSSYDLFGLQLLPVPLTVTVMIIGIAAMFFGPALSVFPLPSDRRRKIANRSLYISIALIVIGAVCVWLRLPGARIEIIFGTLIICFFYGSLTFKSKYEKWKLFARSKLDAFFLSLFDFLGIGMVVLGFLFRLQHWPLSDVFIVFGMVILAIGVLAWNQKFKREVVFRKEAEDKLKESLDKIELQHQALEEKQKEIIDSIRYARRIQASLMPTEKYIENSMKRLDKTKNKEA